MRSAAPGKQAVGNDVRFQATITKTARECRSTAARSSRVSASRAASSPARRARRPSVEIPMRIAVVQGGVSEKVIATKAYRTTVAMAEDGQRAVHPGGR